MSLPRSLLSFSPLTVGRVLLVVWAAFRAQPIQAQAPVSTPVPASSELPRFTLRQMVLGRNQSEWRIPGIWLRTATSIPAESLANRAYRTAASRSGIVPLSGNLLSAERSQHVMGLFRRAELRAASERTLAAIRGAIPSDTTRARFDRIFRPNGEWIIDLHDAALAWSRPRASVPGWQAARPALEGARWVESAEREPESDALPRALYGLATLAASDSGAFPAAQASMWRADSVSAAAALLLLKGYTEGQRWYTDALEFFLREPWVPGQGGQSIQDYVRREWRDAYHTDLEVRLPRIETRWFGYPQAVPQYGIPEALFQNLVRQDNAGATEWLRQNGERGLLRVLRLLPQGDSNLTVVSLKTENLRLATVSRQSRESLNGFLEPEDAIAIDPGYSPLLAIGAVVHEWQHLLFRRRQLERFAQSLGSKAPLSVGMPGIQPHLAEGFAEWSTERILRPVTARWPLLAFGELEKRAALNQRGADDQHALGYALVSALASAVQSPALVTDILLRHADDPSGVIQEPALRSKWGRYRGLPERRLRSPMIPVLIPEVTFTVDGGFPDVVATRILVPVNDSTR